MGLSRTGLAPGHTTVDVEGVDLQRVHAPRGFFRGSLTDVRDMWAFRELLGNLVRKELKVKYKDSILGFFWTLARPLLQLFVYALAIGYFLGASRSIPQFAIFLFTGLLAWGLFTDILGSCTNSIVGNAGLIKKVFFPREIFPLAVTGAALANFVFQLPVLLFAYLLARSFPDPANLPLGLLALLVLVVYAMAFGFVLAAANVYLRDVQYLVEVGLLLWFWMTPIVYDWTRVRTTLVEEAGRPLLFEIYLLNPMANVVMAFHQAFWPGGGTEQGSAFTYDGNLPARLGVFLAVGLVVLYLAQRWFARVQGSFAQEL